MTVFAIIVLFVWIFLLQCKQVEIADSLQIIRKKLDNLSNKDFSQYEPPKPVQESIETVEIVQPSQPTQPIQKTEPVDDNDVALGLLLDNHADSIEDIPDEVIYSKNNTTEIEKTPVNVEKELPVVEKDENSFEQLFLGNIFNKIGALAILVGVLIFIKLISPGFAFGAVIKLLVGFMLGIGFIYWAKTLHGKVNMQSFSEVLLGTGFGTLFITTYCGSVVLNVLSTPVSLIIASILLIAAFLVADKLKTISMLVVSLIAGYLNPFLVNKDFIVDPNFVFGYLIFVNLIAVLYTYRNKNRNTVNIVNLILTFLFTAFTVDNILCPAILWAIYIVYDLVANLKENVQDNRLLNYINLATYILFASIVLKEHMHTGYAIMVVAILNAIVSFIKNDMPELSRHYLYLFLSAFNISIFFLFADLPIWRVCIWTLEVVVLALFAKKYTQKEFLNWAVGVWTAASVATLCIDGVVAATSINEFVPVWNIRLAVFAPLILSSFITSKICQKVEDDKFQSMVNIFKVEYLSMIYLYLGFEANDIINKYYIGKRTSAIFLQNMKNVILGFVYTIQLKRLYNSTKFKLFEIASAFVGAISLIYLLCAGCNYRPATAFIPVINIRVVAFLSAIGASVLYARWSKSEAYKYLAILLGFVLLHTEIKDSIDRFNLLDADYLLSVGWVLYAGIITALGIFRDKQYQKFAGIALCVLAIIRIFIFDLAHVDIIYKFIAFLTLGVILLVLSYIYNKKQK